MTTTDSRLSDLVRRVRDEGDTMQAIMLQRELERANGDAVKRMRRLLKYTNEGADYVRVVAWRNDPAPLRSGMHVNVDMRRHVSEKRLAYQLRRALNNASRASLRLSGEPRVSMRWTWGKPESKDKFSRATFVTIWCDAEAGVVTVGFGHVSGARKSPAWVWPEFKGVSKFDAAVWERVRRWGLTPADDRVVLTMEQADRFCNGTLKRS